MEAKEEYIFVQPASGRYQVPMYIVFFHLCFDQIYHELFKGKVRISFLPAPPSHDTNVSPEVFEYHWSFNPGVNLEQVPVGGNNPSTEWSTSMSMLQCKDPTGLCLLLAGSLWHKGANNRTFPCMEATYPLCQKEPEALDQ